MLFIILTKLAVFRRIFLSLSGSWTVAVIPLIFLFLNDLPAQSPDLDRISTAVVQVASPVATGSGLIYFSGDDAYIITNRHVAEGYNRFMINTLYNVNETAKPSYFAELVHYSPDFDVALLRITHDIRNRTVTGADVKRGPTGSDSGIYELVFAGSENQIRRGEELSLLGYPGIGDNELVYSRGIVASVMTEVYNGREIPIWLRTDANMSPGSSGGIAINAAGQVLGMPTYIRLEERTGGRLGSILTTHAIFAALESDNLLTAWSTESVETGRSRLVPGLDHTLTPNFGQTTLRSGFSRDPFVLQLISGGEMNVNDLNLGSNCTGFASGAPDFRVEWNGNSQSLFFYFNSRNASEDATMIINLPDGSWACNDDASPNTFNPLVEFSNPEPGNYDIWIGSFIRGYQIRGNLIITESAGNIP